MYVEMKNGKYGRFYVLRMKENEVEEMSKGIEYLIENVIKNEHMDEMKKCVISPIRNCKHDDKYDEDGCVSFILKDRDVLDLIEMGLFLMCCAGDIMQSMNYLIDGYREIIEKYNDTFKGFTSDANSKTEEQVET